MAFDLLTSADYPQIRMSIRVDLGPGDLPDEAIAFATPAASQRVLVLDPMAGQWPPGSDEAQRDHDAAVYYAAASLATALPQVLRERFQEYNYEFAPYDYAARADMLRTMAATLLSLNLETSAIDLMRPVAMALAPGGRGDVSEPCIGPAPQPWIGTGGMEPPYVPIPTPP